MRRPLRNQILVPMIGITLLTVAVVSALNAWLASKRVRNQIEQQLADVSHTLSTSNFPFHSNVLRQIRGLTAAEYVAVAPSGHAVAASDESFIAAAEKADHVASHLDLATVVTNDRGRFFHVALPLDRRQSGREKLTLHVFFSEAAWQEARWQAIWPPLMIGAVSIALVAVIVSLLAQRVTRPLHDLHLHVDQIAQGDFRAVSVPKNDDEVHALAVAVNQMAHRLAQYEQQIRASERLRALGTLGSGVAHQIRNSATGCRIALDLHQRDCHSASSNGHSDEPLKVAVKQLEQIEASIQRLLVLGRPQVSTRAKTDLVSVTSDALELVRPMASHLNVGLHAELPQQSLTLQADAHSLTQMIVNLVVNAVEASAQARLGSAGNPVRESAIVQIRLAPLPNHEFELAIGNFGPGPAQRIQPQLFKPFATDKPGGTGLGLAVARQIADDHGGSIRWHQRNNTTWFIITLPKQLPSPTAP